MYLFLLRFSFRSVPKSPQPSTPVYVLLRAFKSMKNMSSATEDRGPLFLQAIWIEAAIASLFVAARIFARIKIQGKLSSDDYLLVLALVIRSLPELRS